MLVDLGHLEKSSTANIERLARALGVDMFDRASWLVEGALVWHHVLARRVAGFILVESLQAELTKRMRLQDIERIKQARRAKVATFLDELKNTDVIPSSRHTINVRIRKP